MFDIKQQHPILERLTTMRVAVTSVKYQNIAVAAEDPLYRRCVWWPQVMQSMRKLLNKILKRPTYVIKFIVSQFIFG